MNKVTNVNSVLETKASGTLDVTEDINKPDGKSIENLLYDEWYLIMSVQTDTSSKVTNGPGCNTLK